MTVRVSTLKGLGAGRYYVEKLPRYYLDAHEPRGQWVGIAAHELGLAGELDDEEFLTIMDGRDPNRPDRNLGRAYGDTSVRGFDVTCSAPKSVSVLFALGDDEVRQRVLQSHDRAVEALVDWIERHAHTRYRIGGEVAVVDASGIVAALFRQHTSRALDPQIHTHVVIPNRVKSPDGRWLALDARLIKRDQRTLSALYHAALRAELTQHLGVRWRTPENGIAEMADVPDIVLTEYSGRTNDILHRIDAKLDRFVATMHRDPTPRERWRLEREAVLDTRPGKEPNVNAAVLHAEWREQARQLGTTPEEIVADAVGQVAPRRSLDQHETAALIDRAIAAISERQSTWRPTELQRELAGLLATDLGIDAARVIDALDELADWIATHRCVDISAPVPTDALLRRDGRPVSESGVDRALTTQAILDQEHDLLDWAERRLDAGGDVAPAAIDRADVDLNIAQADAASRVAGDEQLVLVVGPAGTGKTTALRPAVAQLRADGRPVIGVAPSAGAAEVLEDETGVVSDTLDKLLIEHRLDRPPDYRYDLPAGTTLIVDEAGMTSTRKLAELAALADRKRWRVVLVGDPMQFSAVGRGGMFGLFVDTYDAVELDRVHRFDNDWERDASLRLRRGDTDVAELYDHHGRLHGGTEHRMRAAAITRWWIEREAGRTALLMAPTNHAVDELNHYCQLVRIGEGQLDPMSPSVRAGAHTIFIGDEIATRDNDRRLLTDRRRMVRNRAEWTVTAIHPDGSISAEGRSGCVRLPKEYVAQHVDLAYARTGAGAQGRTVDVAILYLDGPTDVRNLYVPMTRGRSTNDVFVATTGEQTALDVVAQSIATDWIDRPALARRAELRKVEDIRPEIARSRQSRRRDVDRLEPELGIDLAATPKHRPTKRWSELREIERALARWAGRGPEDYLPEPGAEPSQPSQPWSEMSENERLRAELSSYASARDGRRTAGEWRQAPRPELPGIDLPGL
ncbi:MAG: MobF family relaxase [Ilumatobacter sp.]|uniref:MobF family relaxase n=1 Tax=Ilumatobacter sp. TaxID=1967498 RepID=UPI00391BB2F0